ncbi:MAG: LLM class F420-dependent oxidoreductase [Candidatus Tectomicrobia bacterium]|nr:LLM class F420-dependent oxidoreductase [Candidatus Tectomicrobia bacterium]
MKLAVEFPSVSYREGPAGVARLAKAIEDIGYDQLDMFDHVVMGFPTEGREEPRYAATMPILEALMTLSYAAAVTSTIGLGTEVLVLSQRQPVLVAKQVSTLDTLSGGRVRLGVGIGWQPSEFEALGENFRTRGKRADEAIELMRACWRDSQIDYDGRYYRSVAMGMEPKSPQGGQLPIWIGGNTAPAFKRIGAFGDGWLASQVTDAEYAKRCMDAIREAAAAAGRDPEALGWQSSIVSPPRPGDTTARMFYADLDQVAARAVAIKAMGFGWAAVNATAVFQSGARSLDAMIEALGRIHDRLRREVGS